MIHLLRRPMVLQKNTWLNFLLFIFLLGFLATWSKVFPTFDTFAITYLSSKPSPFLLSKPTANCINGKPETQLAWGVSNPVTSYVVSRKSSRGAWEVISTRLIRKTSFLDTAAALNETYSYRIIAIKGNLRRISNIETFLSSCSSFSSSSQNSIRPRSSMPAVSAFTTKLWGAYVGEQATAAATFEAKIGKTMNMQAIFMGASDSLPSEYGKTVRDQGKTLVIFWEPWDISLDSIIGGGLDATIKEFALDATDYHGPIIFVPFHEMNGDWDSWGATVDTNTPAKLIEAWKHVHALLKDVPNIKFGWAVNNDSVPDTPENAIAKYYPGDAYTDYVGIDGFNFDDDSWQTFDEIFGNALKIVAGYKKPVIIFSMATAEGPKKADWITDALTVQIPKHPEITGWIWFNQNKEKNWLIWSDDNALKAFQNAVQN